MHSKHGRDEKYIKNIVIKPEGKRSPERPRHSWYDNRKMDHKEGLDRFSFSQQGP
jgi:hypothetical protein